MNKREEDELTDQLTELWQRRIDGKISEARMRRDMLALLEANTINTAAQNRKVINDFVKTANATRDLYSSFNALGGLR